MCKGDPIHLGSPFYIYFVTISKLHQHKIKIVEVKKGFSSILSNCIKGTRFESLNF